MAGAPEELKTQRHDATGLRRQRADLLAVYEEVYAARLGDPFFTSERFWERLEGYAARGGFELVTGRVGDELVGYTLGYTLPASSGWWRGVRGEIDPELLVETGSRTFAVNELMVRPPWRRLGYAKALHDALLYSRTEARATLLVRAENTAAYEAYRSWGWQTIGQLQPYEDAPVYEAMMRELRPPTAASS